MNVKCKICSKMIDRDTAFKIAKNKTNQYYCSENEYKKHQEIMATKQKQKDNLQILIDEIFGYHIINSALYKEETEWFKTSSLDNIILYLKDNKNYISDVLINKNFTSEYAKIRYFSAIIKNSIVDYKPSKPEIPKQIDVEIYETKYKPKAKRKCLSDYEDGDDDA